jgi:hypothetical protein
MRLIAVPKRRRQRLKLFWKKELTHFPPFTEACAKQRFLHTCALCIVAANEHAQWLPHLSNHWPSDCGAAAVAPVHNVSTMNPELQAQSDALTKAIGSAANTLHQDMALAVAIVACLLVVLILVVLFKKP